MDFAIQKSTRRQHHSSGLKLQADLRNRTAHSITFQQQIFNRLLENTQIGLVLETRSNGLAVQNTVCLRTGSPHSRAFGTVQNTELNPSFVGSDGHCTAQSIHLFDQMALTNTTNRRVTRHLPKCFDVVGQQQGFASSARGCKCSLGACMTTAHNNDIKLFGIKHDSLLALGAGIRHGIQHSNAEIKHT